jgi:hydrogenase maturation protease
MKTIVLGVGNPILQDDGVGVHVIQKLQQSFHDPFVVVDIAFTGGLNLLDLMKGYDKVILVDAVRKETGRIGEVQRLSLDDTSVVHSGNPHDVSLSEALLLAKNLGEVNLPREIVIIGVVVNPTYEFGEELSTEVKNAIPAAVQMILSEIKNTERNT